MEKCLSQITLDNGSGVKFFTKYDYFKISNETDSYRIHVSGYSGTAPDEMHNIDGMTFTTMDHDTDAWHVCITHSHKFNINKHLC